MVHWNSSPHPISDIRDWTNDKRLELRPDFQRREVWSVPARIMLVDTILQGVPMPKIFLANTIRDGNTYRIVIDGQQRISAILAFLRDEFSLETPYPGREKGKKFSQLDKKAQNRFLRYQIDFNEATDATDEEIRKAYGRVNKYTFPLKKQELRRADFPGDFLKVSEELSIDPYLDRIGIFSPADRRRYADAEYVSELLAAMLDGPQDKKSTLDDYYIRYTDWDSKKQKKIMNRFSKILEELQMIFDDCFDISKTRFRQKADFYTIFLVIDDFIKQKTSLKGRDLGPLRNDLGILQDGIRPESEFEVFREYAIKCVSQANSASSRRWRHRFLKSILAGTYVDGPPDLDAARLFYRMRDQLPGGESCPVCKETIAGDFGDCVLAWPRSATSIPTQMSNAEWLHRSCAKKKNRTRWLFVERPKND